MYYKISKTAAREYAEKMNSIDDYCKENGISHSLMNDSYYFELNGCKYRVSNHTVAASNKKAFNHEGQQVRSLYHPGGEEEGVTYITAGKTRIKEIYEKLKAGKKLNRRGYEIN